MTYGEAAAKAGLDADAIGRDDEVVRRIAAFVELHVEQGFTLAAEEVDAPLGVCGLIRPHGRWRVDLRGPRRPRRAPPGSPTAQTPCSSSPAWSRPSAAVGEPAGRARHRRARSRSHPNVPNAVPSRVSAWVDIRGGHAGAGQVRRLGDPRRRLRPRGGVLDAGDDVRPRADRRGRAGRRGGHRRRPRCPCSPPAPATTPACCPPPASPQPCCSCGTPRASPTRRRSTSSRRTSSAGYAPWQRSWPICVVDRARRPARPGVGRHAAASTVRARREGGSAA